MFVDFSGRYPELPAGDPPARFWTGATQHPRSKRLPVEADRARARTEGSPLREPLVLPRPSSHP